MIATDANMKNVCVHIIGDWGPALTCLSNFRMKPDYACAPHGRHDLDPMVMEVR